MAKTCNKNMAALVAALESGDYRQARSYLKIVLPDGETGMCCAGVASDLAARDGVGGWVREAGYDYEQFVDAGYIAGDLAAANHVSASTMTDGVVAWLGLDAGEWDGNLQNLPVLDDAGAVKWGTELNDTGAGFADIARLLRVTYLDG